jgi:alcohol dehydrogenase (NADP+)
MGCPVTVLSHGERKVEHAFKLGASDFRDIDKLSTSITRGSNGKHFHTDLPNASNINVLLVTSNAVPELESVLSLLARRATIVLMTIQQETITVPYMQFVLPGHKLITSTEASRDNHYKMLECAAEHKIEPWVEEFPMTLDGVQTAMKRLEDGQIRYRAVLVRGEPTEER